ncbi:MAG: calcium/sodium antiporter [Floccifex sp.]
MIIEFLLLLLGFILLTKGSDLFVDGASEFARYLHVPQLIIGLTIVAMGTSAPEAAVSIRSALENSADLSIGNIVGSNILNVLIILGICSLFAFIPIEKSTTKKDIPFMIFSTALLLIFGYTDASLSWFEGCIFLVWFIVYLIYLYTHSNKEEEQKPSKSILKILLFIILGLAFILLGSQFVVESATKIALYLGVDEKFIGLTIVAFGTSLPELFTSFMATRKGNAGIAIGNIVGSNIFNILFILGFTSLLTPIPFQSSFLIDTCICILTGIVLWYFAYRKNGLNKRSGILMLVSYGLYFLYLI